MLAIEEISLLSVSSKPSFSLIFEPATFPSLKALTWYGGEKEDDDFGVTLLSLVDYVEAFALDLSDLSELSKSLVGKLMDKTLFDQFARSSSILPSVKFLRLYSVDPEPWSSPTLFGTLTKLVSQASSKFTLYLPSIVEPAYLTSGTGHTAAENFRAECDRKGIEVVFEEQPSNWSFDIEMPRDFWRRLKERKGQENGKIKEEVGLGCL